MRTQRAIQFVYTLIFMTWTHTDAASTKSSPLCPIGFSLANPKDGDPICYRQKGPETFSESFNDCTGNLYTAKLYNSIDLPRTNKVLWTEYKSKYPGGPFIDWSYTDSTGDILLTTFDVKYDSSLGIDEELCVVIDPVSNFTATRCDGKHYRYCFVKPYNDDDDKIEGCTDFRGSWRFYSPSATCLAPVTGVGGGPVRATWRQAQDMCFKRGGSLVNRGWRFSNHPSLSLSGSLPMFPLGVVTNQDQSLVEFEEISGLTEIPKSEWHFQKNRFSNDATLGAVRNDFWYLVNSSYIFFDVICERPVQLKNISLELIVNWENKIILTVNDTIKKDFFRCFTDSRTIYSSEVSISRSDDHKQTFTLSPAVDGYYWCIHNNYKDYQISESNKVLFIRSRESLVNLYACKIRFRSEYRMENLDKLNKVTRKRLEEFVYYRTKYIDIYGEINTTNAYRLEKLLKTFKSEKPDLDWKDSDVIYSLQLKRLYMDLRSALVHVTLNPEMKPLLPGRWEGLEVEYMRPAYFCPAFDSVPSRALGESVTSTGCRTFTCIGDFNEGVQWLVTATQACSTSAPAAVTRMINLEDVMPTAMAPTTTADHKYLMHERTSESSEESPEKPMTRSTTKETTPCITIEFTEGYYDFSTVSPPTEVVTVTTPPDVSTVTTPPDTTELPTTIKPPRPTPLPPEEQLDQVLDDLAVLLQNDSIPIDAISDTFDQVNDILDVQDEDLQIPGQLLHMLDELGSRVQLDGAPTATKIRENIALLLADATPQNPIRGLKVAVRDSDAFTNNSFAFIDDVITDDQLIANKTEALVYLPDSITRTPRRVSFVAFRNQKAFQSDLVVNSRVFSINVENLTHFDDGEVIDIHLTPTVGEPDRNLSRVCAYWHFDEASGGAGASVSGGAGLGAGGGAGGYWSQAGCTLVRAARAGLLDTCRCTHLTHFAEVLVPRTVFSERNEAALEILSLVGCFLSVFGLIAIGVTASLFRSWRRDYSNKIWLQLCVAIFVLVVCFVVVVFANFDRYDVPCMLVGVALHYSVLASFCWMLVAAVLSYRRLVLVFTRDVSHKLLRASAFAWGAPCAVVGVLLSVDPHSYAGRFEEKSPSGSFCYPSGLALWLAVYAPIAVMLLANWTLFALIVRSVFASRRIQRHGDTNEALRCASVSCLLVFLFGLPWIFGLFAYNVVLAYLFTLTATYQGFVLFVFFVLGNKKTRDLWLNKLKIKQTRKVPVTSSTYTNRSTGAGWRGGTPAAASTIEAKASKPRSLSTPDDSRFS